MAQPIGHDDTSVVTYIDGVPQPLFVSDLRFLDVERIDVLQGTPNLPTVALDPKAGHIEKRGPCR